MAKKLKCSSCGEFFEKEQLTLKSGKKYCNTCLEAREQQIESNKSDWTLLFEYICKIYNIDRPTGLMFKQLKDFRGEEYQYTNIGMYYTLKYYYEVSGNEVLDGTGLGIIPYYYDKAKLHYTKIFDLQDVVEEYKSEEQIVKINTRMSKRKIEERKPLSLNIDWEEVNEDN